MSSWFSASAVVPSLREDWGITTGQGTLLTIAVQLGFVTGAVTSAVLSLADRWPAHRLAAGSALLAALTTATGKRIALGKPVIRLSMAEARERYSLFTPVVYGRESWRTRSAITTSSSAALPARSPRPLIAHST